MVDISGKKRKQKRHKKSGDSTPAANDNTPLGQAPSGLISLGIYTEVSPVNAAIPVTLLQEPPISVPAPQNPTLPFRKR